MVFSDYRRTHDGLTARLFLQLPLQLAHECREAGAALALEPLGLQDRLHLGEGLVDVVIDDDVVVLAPKWLISWLARSHAAADHLVGILRAGVQPLFQSRQPTAAG